MNNTSKNNRKKVWGYFAAFLLLLLVVSIAAYLFIYRANVEPRITQVKTNDDELYSFDKLKKSLNKYDLIRHSFEKNKNGFESGSYVVPGLKTTTTLDHESGKFSICTSMTPQSVCIIGNYILIGAYCHTGKHNSVIYVLNKKEHKLIKTIVLKDRTHAGGLAYDEKYENIWVTGMGSIAAQTNSFSLKDMENYNFNLGHQPIRYSQSYPLFSIVRDSFMTYHEGYLYAGYFSDEGESVLQKFRINKLGGLKTVSAEDYKKALKLSYIPSEIALPVGIAAIPERIQGVTFYKDKMLLSQSYGVVKSHLLVYDNCNDSYFVKNQYDKKHISKSMEPEKVFELPQKMEQIMVDRSDVYALFESAAYCYRGYSFPRIDRLLKLDADYIISSENK